MKLQIFSRKLKDSLTTNQILSIGLVACVLLALLQQFKINQMRERIVLQPPGLTERAEIGTSAANEPYYKSWGIFVASLVGSVTPSESEAALKVMEPYFTREAWLPVRSHINSIRLDPNYQQYAAVNQFMPKLAIYEPSTKKTFIQGTQKTSVYRDNKAVPLSQVEVTYEMNIVIQSGIPKVASITSYRGPAHTLEWAQRFPSTAAAFKAEQAKQADQLTPQLSPTSIEPGAMDSGEPARAAPVPVPATAPQATPAPAQPAPATPGAPDQPPPQTQALPPPPDPFQPSFPGQAKPGAGPGQPNQPSTLSSSDRL